MNDKEDSYSALMVELGKCMGMCIGSLAKVNNRERMIQDLRSGALNASYILALHAQLEDVLRHSGIDLRMPDDKERPTTPVGSS